MTGTLDRVERITRFVAFEIRARLHVPSGADPNRARQVLETAERSCLISNSLSAQVHLIPTIEVAQETGIVGWCSAYSVFGISTAKAPAGHCPNCDTEHHHA